MLRGALATSLLVLAGCGGGPALGPPAVTTAPPAGLPTVAMRLGVEVGWPARLARVLISIDGAPWLIAPNDGVRAIPSALPAMQVAAGEHTVVVRFDVTVPCDAASAESGTVQIRAGRSFVLTERDAAVVSATVTDRGVFSAPADRYVLALEAAGAHGVDYGTAYGAAPGPSPTTYPQCDQKRDPLAHAECVARAYVDASRQARDIVAVLCGNSRLTEILALRRTHDDAVTEATPHGAALAAAAESRAAALESDVVNCVARDPIEWSGPTVTLTGCGDVDDWIAARPDH